MAGREHFIWVEKYRPHTIDDCVLPDAIKTTFKEFVEKGEIPNLLLCGSAGVGKTTIARALCEEMGVDYLFVNASEERTLGVLRGKIMQFASSMSLEGLAKVVILDEGDNIAYDTQQALKGALEEFAANCRFIFTANFKNRIISPIQSRCVTVEFHLTKEDKPKMASAFMGRLRNILEKEGVVYNKEAVARLLMKYFPDYRKILNELQRYSATGKIDEGVLIDFTEDSYITLTKHLREKEWTQMRKWVASNMDNDPNKIIRMIFDTSNKYVESDSIPQLILILADYQSKVPFVVDQELNLVAMLTEIMASVKFKME